MEVNRVTTCGSVGKRTDSTHSADLDIVVYVNGLEPENMKERFPCLLDEIQHAMDQQYPGTRDDAWYRKFGLRYNVGRMEIDILIGAPSIVPRDFLGVSDAEQRQYMSASVSHLVTRFIKNQSPFFQDMVRVAKHWRDSFSWAPQCKPKSYLLELIMLEAFRKLHLCTRQRGNTYVSYQRSYVPYGKILLKFFELISSVDKYSREQECDKHNLPPLFICFEKFYNKDDLPLDQPEPLFELNRRVGKGRNAKTKTRKATAIVMDPANPTNNLWLTLGNAETLVSRARNAAEELKGH